MFTFFLFFLISPFLLILLYVIPFFLISFLESPKLNKIWTKLEEKLPYFEVLGETIFVKNYRQAIYKNKSEWQGEVHWLNKKFEIKDIEKLVLYVNPYAYLQSHVILSFVFKNGSNLCFSYEIRKTTPEHFKVYNVLYRNYEGYFCVGSEEDIVYVRKYIRKKKLLYRFEINSSKNKIQDLLKLLIKEVNTYSKKAFFYRILYRNCVSEIFDKLSETKIFNIKNRFEYLNVPKLVFKNREHVSSVEKENFKKFLKEHKY
jgi:hypothetical protein